MSTAKAATSMRGTITSAVMISAKPWSPRPRSEARVSRCSAKAGLDPHDHLICHRDAVTRQEADDVLVLRLDPDADVVRAVGRALTSLTHVRRAVEAVPVVRLQTGRAAGRGRVCKSG